MYGVGLGPPLSESDEPVSSGLVLVGRVVGRLDELVLADDTTVETNASRKGNGFR